MRDQIRSSDRIGQKFNKLTILQLVDKEKCKKRQLVLCKCDCGNEKIMDLNAVVTGSIKSCGCLQYAFNTSLKYISSSEKPKDNTSGCKGVCWDCNKQKWYARIGIQGRNIHLGRFDDFQDAVKARKEAEKKYYLPIIEIVKNR